MLNRIYIIVGMLAIIVLAGAFIAPRFVQWGDYRGRMEELATGVLGTPVTIRGDIEFALLPQPRLTFTNVLVGSPEAPAATVDGVEAEFSLMDFLRDNYNVTKLVLRGPVVDFTIDESGLLGSGVSVAGAGSSVGLGQTTIVDGTVRLLDRRTAESVEVSDIDGDLRLTSFSGPFQFQGSGASGGQRYGFRLNSSTLDANGSSRLSASLRQEAGAFSYAAEGAFTPGMAPKFDGTLVYRQAPPATTVAEDIRGDLVFESKFSASTDRVVLAGYTLQPDENRAGTRLTGAASIQLGDRRAFDAVISGGVFSLPPRDANEDASTLPYEVVRLLGELPAPPLPPLPGRIGVDLAEVGLRAFALRTVRMDASFDGDQWQVEQFTAQLPGDTTVRASGALLVDGDAPSFQGRLSVSSQRLDALAALWRKPAEDAPLFNLPGSFESQLILAGDAFGLVGGRLTLAGATHGVEVRLGFGEEKRLDVVTHFGALGTTGSAAVGALLPNLTSDPAFGLSFPYGSLSFSAETAQVFGQDGAGLAAEGQWTPDALILSRLAAEQWGGLGFDARLNLAGTLAEPEITGAGSFMVANGAAPALVAFYDALETPQAWRNFIGLSAPADLSFDIGAANAQGWQTVTLEGPAGAGELDLRADLSGGLGGLVAEPLRVTLALEGDDATAMTRQIGLGEAELFSGTGPMLLAVTLEGAPDDRLKSQITASQDDESISFAGDLEAAGSGEISGSGSLTVALEEAGGLAYLVGARGLSLPKAAAQAQVHFEGERVARLTEITGTSGEVGFAGELSLSRLGSSAAVSGNIDIEEVSIEGLAATMFGPAAMVAGLDIWPEGPIDIGSDPRRTRGTVALSAPLVTGGGEPRLADASFELSWDETKLRLGRFAATIGDAGSINLDLTVCCTGPLTDKTASGRFSVSGATLDALVPEQVAATLDGVIDGGVRFETAGTSIAGLMGGLAGEGSFTLAEFSVGQLGPGVFPTVAGLEDVLDMDPDALGAIIGLSLAQGAFTAPTATGAFTLAGGVARLANFIVEGDGGRLAGSLNTAMRTLGLDGSFVLTPRDFTDETGLVGEDTSRIIARLAGTLPVPSVTLDLAEMVAAIQVRANELEVERLEILRAEDAERQRAAAEERNRLIEEQRRKAAEEAARLAAEEAARLAEEEEARRLQQEQPAPAPQPLPLQGPLDLGLPPANQPFGAGVNQPFLAPVS